MAVSVFALLKKTGSSQRLSVEGKCVFLSVNGCCCHWGKKRGILEERWGLRSEEHESRVNLQQVHLNNLG